MAAANVGGSLVVGADRNRDGIPDAMQGSPFGVAAMPTMYTSASPRAATIAPPPSSGAIYGATLQGSTTPSAAMAYSATAPMAAANVGGTCIVGADRNFDGIPDALQRPMAAGAYGGAVYGAATPPAPMVGAFFRIIDT